MTNRPSRARRLLHLSVAITTMIAFFAVVTGVALESGGVAVLETRDGEGGQRTTHVWYVESEGVLWVEAGAPENGWFLDVGRVPRLTFRSPTRSGSFVAEPSPDRADADWLRARLREKYGWRDAWVGMLVDASQSSAVRLIPTSDSSDTSESSDISGER